MNDASRTSMICFFLYYERRMKAQGIVMMRDDYVNEREKKECLVLNDYLILDDDGKWKKL